MEEEEVTLIAELARRKMSLEVDAKTKEMENLKVQKEMAKEELKHISSEIDQLGRFVEQERKIVSEHEKEETSDQQKIEKLRELLQELEDGLSARQIVIVEHQRIVEMKEAQQGKLRAKFKEVEKNVKKLDEQIAGLPSASGYSQDVLSLLDEQIAAKRKELECPVCFEECLPPIYTCSAQHLICANCRPALKECGFCRVPYQQMLRHRYAERDHSQLVDLCRQQAALQQKLLVKSGRNDQVVRHTGDNDALPPQQGRKAPAYVPPHRRAGQQPLQKGDIQVFVELPTRVKRTIVLFVKHSTSVKEVKEMVEAKSDRLLPASRMRLSYKGGNHLSSDELPIKVSQGDTLVCCPTWR